MENQYADEEVLAEKLRGLAIDALAHRQLSLDLLSQIESLMSGKHVPPETEITPRLKELENQFFPLARELCKDKSMAVEMAASLIQQYGESPPDEVSPSPVVEVSSPKHAHPLDDEDLLILRAISEHNRMTVFVRDLKKHLDLHRTQLGKRLARISAAGFLSKLTDTGVARYEADLDVIREFLKGIEE